jgi:uncharacterized protein (DUF488 family)
MAPGAGIACGRPSRRRALKKRAPPQDEGCRYDSNLGIAPPGWPPIAVFFTIGHSTRSLAELVEILEIEKIRLLADVRAFPRSRTHPQFNAETLSAELAARGIEYVHIPALGGRRGRQQSASPNTFWQNESFRNYADFAMTGAFQRAFAELRSLGTSKPCAIMCAEALWWRCHRRIITDYLIFAGERVVHLFGAGKKEDAKATPAARQTCEGTIVYAEL